MYTLCMFNNDYHIHIWIIYINNVWLVANDSEIAHIFSHHSAMVVNRISADEFLALGLEQAGYTKWNRYKEKRTLIDSGTITEPFQNRARTFGLIFKLLPTTRTASKAMLTQSYFFSLFASCGNTQLNQTSDSSLICPKGRFESGGASMSRKSDHCFETR